MQLHWHRSDLRIADNRSLSGVKRVLPIYVLDKTMLSHAGAARISFLCDALSALRADYRQLGADLLVVKGKAENVIPTVSRFVDAREVHWNVAYTGLGRRRDGNVERRLREDGTEVQTHHDAVLVEPGAILTTDGTPYQVFSYFHRKWRDREKAEPRPSLTDVAVVDATVVEETYEALEKEESTAIAPDRSVPTPVELDVEPPNATIPEAGADAARELLRGFCAGPIYRYESERDRPAADATSRLSPHLKFGTIGIRDVFAATASASSDADEIERASIEEFQSQLAWRDFYTHSLYFRPELVSENHRDLEIEWRNDREELAAWRAGETGYPIVDAGMRQLEAEAWMHNRVRMIVASFLTKDLLIDWRTGYRWFKEKLVDHDTANEVGGWQWAAGTGTDAQPFFRIFNPSTQGERYDPDAAYVKEYVPELREVAPSKIHRWVELDSVDRRELAPGYPDPIVDHAERREKALAAFDRARNT